MTEKYGKPCNKLAPSFRSLKPRVEEPPKPSLDLLFPELFGNDEGAPKTPPPTLNPTPPLTIPTDDLPKLDP